MAALLVALESTTRTRRAGLVIAAFAMVAAVAVIAAVRSQSPAAIECSAPAMDPDRVWSTPRAFMLATRDPELAKLAASDVAAWHAARSHACAMVPAERLPRLACLDAALARLDDALRAAVTESAAVDADELELELVDPVVCDRAPTPQLAPLTPELSSMFRFIRRARLNDSPVTGAEVESADRASSPCARALRALDRLAHGLLLFPIRDREVERARDLVAHCDDDKIRAAIAVRVADFNSDPARAAAAVARFPQADLRAELEAIGARHARQIMQWDLARTGYERAIELYGARSRARAQVGQIVELGRVLLQSGRPEDLARLGELAKQWLPIARGTDRSELEKLAQQLRWRQGDVAAADRELERLSAMADTAGIGTFTYDSFIGVTGEVVDEAGVPIANATVHSGEPLVGDAATAAMQLYTTGKRTAHTDGGGRFSLPFAHGAVVAQSGLLRSRPTAVASHVHLVLQPTTHAEGKVALGTAAASKLWVVAHGSDAVSANAVVVATVRPDGSFRLDGLPHGDLVIGAVEIGGCGVGDRPNHIKGDEREHILLAPSPPLYVIARSSDLAAPESAMIWAFTGYAVPPHPIYSSLMRRMPQRLDSTQFSAALPVDLAHVPTALAGTARADDLIGVFADRPEGDLVVCGLGFDKKQVGAANTFSQETGKAMLNEELACTTVAATQSVVILPLLPLRKFQAK